MPSVAQFMSQSENIRHPVLPGKKDEGSRHAVGALAKTSCALSFVGRKIDPSLPKSLVDHFNIVLSHYRETVCNILLRLLHCHPGIVVRIHGKLQVSIGHLIQFMNLL